MKTLTCKEIREKWIEFFTKKCGKEHKHIPSGSLIPDNPTLLLNAAGMVQFVPYFLGTKEAPNPPRAITIQKCVRVGGKDSDLENIGRTSRHHSFFEMLGNFSFGDYFKPEVIPWAWQFVTEEIGFPKDKLTISVFGGDDGYPFDQEAYDIWLKVLKDSGVEKPESKIEKKGRSDNFWGPPGPTGPCGPCSEIHFDRGPKFTDPDERYLEVWNLVFMESDKDDEGKFTPLAKKNIDTGAGLERIAMLLQDKPNTFETDEFFSIIQSLEKELGVKYCADSNTDLYLKIIADHLRCLSFLIADGVRPSNLARGYVLRMIIRRAARFVYLLTGNANATLYKLTDKVVEIYSEFYPELKENQSLVSEVTKKEEEQFARTIENGLARLNEGLKKKVKDSKEGTKVLDGAFAFDLYSTYGLPLELTQEIALENNIEVDKTAYEKAKEKHSEASSTDVFAVSVLKNKELPLILKEVGETKFIGYDALNTKAKVLAILDHEGKRVSSTKESKEYVQVILDQTTFYAESGGQLGDKGEIEGLEVIDTQRSEGLIIHSAQIKSGEIKVGDNVEAKVDPENRRLSIAHHSNCHLLQAALKKVLGDSIQQQGSQVGANATRFDFNFDRGMTKEELKKLEDILNKWVQMELPVKAEEMSMEEAKKRGALAFFGEKYGDSVRVLTMGNEKELASVELCGGCHVKNTKEIELVKVVSEGSVAAGIRRIKLVVSDKAREFIKEKELKDQEEKAKAEAAEKAKAEAKAQKAEMAKKALEILDDLVSKAEDISDNKAIIQKIDGLDGDSLRTLAQASLDKLGSGLVLLATATQDNKVVLISAVSEDLSKNINAGNIVKEAAGICGGGGGGRPNFAQAGGKNPEKISEALETIRANLLKDKVS